MTSIGPLEGENTKSVIFSFLDRKELLLNLSLVSKEWNLASAKSSFLRLLPKKISMKYSTEPCETLEKMLPKLPFKNVKGYIHEFELYKKEYIGSICILTDVDELYYVYYSYQTLEEIKILSICQIEEDPAYIGPDGSFYITKSGGIYRLEPYRKKSYERVDIEVKSVEVLPFSGTISFCDCAMCIYQAFRKCTESGKVKNCWNHICKGRQRNAGNNNRIMCDCDLSSRPKERDHKVRAFLYTSLIIGWKDLGFTSYVHRRPAPDNDNPSDDILVLCSYLFFDEEEDIQIKKTIELVRDKMRSEVNQKGYRVTKDDKRLTFSKEIEGWTIKIRRYDSHSMIDELVAVSKIGSVSYKNTFFHKELKLEHDPRFRKVFSVYYNNEIWASNESALRTFNQRFPMIWTSAM